MDDWAWCLHSQRQTPRLRQISFKGTEYFIHAPQWPKCWSVTTTLYFVMNQPNVAFAQQGHFELIGTLEPATPRARNLRTFETLEFFEILRSSSGFGSFVVWESPTRRSLQLWLRCCFPCCGCRPRLREGCCHGCQVSTCWDFVLTIVLAGVVVMVVVVVVVLQMFVPMATFSQVLPIKF